MKRILKLAGTFLALTLIVVIGFIFLFGHFTQAAQGISRPFGGIILAIIPCTCSANALVILGPPTPGMYTMDFGTRLYANFSPSPGRWVLGLADAYAPCLQFVLIGCAPFGGGPRMRMMGTS